MVKSDSKSGEAAVELRGEGLKIADLARVARRGAPVRLTDDPAVRGRVDASRRVVVDSAGADEAVYGITTGFGAMADVRISSEEAAALQENIFHFMSTGAGGFLPTADVRAAMLLRANSHLRGVSGLRFELIRRVEVFLNAGATPRVRELGSIGASGDLTPLAQIMGAVCGLSPHFRVDFQGDEVDCVEALARLGLEPIRLGPKEGLAMVNGTSVMTGSAAVCLYDFRGLLGAALYAHSLFLQALRASNQSFHPFIHEHKPHPGQVRAAALVLELLEGSSLCRDELDGSHAVRAGEPIQDRYSLRCLPQYLGPIIDGLERAWGQIEVEMNCANDNPLIDPESGHSYHAGNFLGQYVGVAMDHLRYYLGLLVKHLDVQIALLMAPEFSNGLPASLVGNPGRRVNMGLKGLQITGNSIMPLLSFFGNSLADRFPTHAEQFNQNVNSQGFGSANLARQSVDIARQYLALSLMIGVQAVDLRTFTADGHYDARASLSPATVPFYEAFHELLGLRPGRTRPYVWDDDEQFLDDHIERVAADLGTEGRISEAIEPVVGRLLSAV